MQKIITIVIISLLFASCAIQRKNQPDSQVIHYYQTTTQKPYDDVLAELQIAIAEQNFRITGHSRVGQVIRERGAKEFPEYDTLQFCNLTRARSLLEISPQAISYMPCNVVTFQYKGVTVIKTHLLPVDTDNKTFNQLAIKINEQLKQIVDFAAEQ